MECHDNDVAWLCWFNSLFSQDSHHVMECHDNDFANNEVEQQIQEATIRGSRSRSPVTLRHQSVGQARLSESITNVIDSIIHLLEGEEIDRNKLEKRILHYFNQGAKGLEFGQKTFKELVNDYADAVYSSMFSGLDANRNWLTKADFLLVVDAGVKGHFPSELLDGVPRLQLERTILQAVEIQEGSYFLDELTNFQRMHQVES